jgi:phosphoenolpyruvate carboxylase
MKEQPEEFELFKKATRSDSLIRYVLTNVDTSLAATDLEIMDAYANLVEDREVRESIMAMFKQEFEKTRKMLDLLLEKSFEERRVNHHYSSTLRASAMKVLHLKQVQLLKKWRLQKLQEDEGAEKTLLTLLLTINAIASAMRNTG